MTFKELDLLEPILNAHEKKDIPRQHLFNNKPFQLSFQDQILWVAHRQELDKQPHLPSQFFKTCTKHKRTKDGEKFAR